MASRMNKILRDALLTGDYKYGDIVHADFTYYYIVCEQNHDDTSTRFVLLTDGEKYVLAVIPEEGESLLSSPVDYIRYIGSGFWGISANEKTLLTDAEAWEADEKIPFVGTFDTAVKGGSGWIVVSDGGKKNAIVPDISRSSLFFRDWVDSIISAGEVAWKVSKGGNASALNKNGELLASNVVSVTAYGAMGFIRCSDVAKNIVINDEGNIILKGISTFTGYGNYAAVQYSGSAYEIVGTNGRMKFSCTFDKVVRLGMDKVGLNYCGLWYIFDIDFNRLSKYGFHTVDRYVKKFVNEYNREGFLLVSRYGKYNYLTENGNILLPFWCEKAEPFNYSKTAEIEYGGKTYIVYDCRNERRESCEIRTTRPNIRVREKRRNPDIPAPLLSLSHEVVQGADKSYRVGDVLLRGVTPLIENRQQENLPTRVPTVFLPYTAAEYGKMVHNIIETIESEGTWVYDLKCNGDRNILGEEVSSIVVQKYIEMRKGFGGVYVEDEYSCWGCVEFMVRIDFVFADVNGGAILVELKTNAEYPEKYLREQMSMQKHFFMNTNPHIERVKTYCFWLPRGNLEASEIRAVSADMTEDEIREYLHKQVDLIH